MGYSHKSLETRVLASELIIRGKVIGISLSTQDPDRWRDVSIEILEALKGDSPGKIVLTMGKWTEPEMKKVMESGVEQLWFLRKTKIPKPGYPDEYKHSNKRQNLFEWLSRPVPMKGPLATLSGNEKAIFSMNFSLLRSGTEVLEAVRLAVKAGAGDKSHGFHPPRSLMQLCGTSGDANSLLVPADHRLESIAQELIDSPGTTVARASRHIVLDGGSEKDAEEFNSQMKVWHPFLQKEGVQALANFQSEENIKRLKSLLGHPATKSINGSKIRYYYVREAAYKLLKEWNVDVDKPVLDTGDE